MSVLIFRKRRKNYGRERPKCKTASSKGKKRSRRPDFLALGGIDVFFLLLVIAILTIGLVMLFSASYTYAFYNKRGTAHTFLSVS